MRYKYIKKKKEKGRERKGRKEREGRREREGERGKEREGKRENRFLRGQKSREIGNNSFRQKFPKKSKRHKYEFYNI